MNRVLKLLLTLTAGAQLISCAMEPAQKLPTQDIVSTEGMWQPHQLPEIGEKLKSLGLELDPRSMTDLTQFPLNAVISLGNCSASFVSPQGLVITNHHCAYSSIAYNSTEDKDILADGFLALTKGQELPAAPGSRVYVTVEINEVTKKVNDQLTENMSGAVRYKAIQDAQKLLVADCEKDEGHRCEVYSFHGGLNYYLIKQLAIRDVRLVHTPPASIGKFGGDIDNWMWPRHTGDYAFYRAYVGLDGKPADFSKENIPYTPKHFLKVAPSGPSEGDFVMLAGYPGNTNRYRMAAEVENTFDWYYPKMQQVLSEWSATITDVTKSDKDAELKYASSIAGLNNYAKNFSGMLEGYVRSDLLDRKRALEKSLGHWINSDTDRKAKYQSTLDDIKALVLEKQSTQERDLVLRYMGRSAMLSAAQKLYRLSIENEKPNMEREPNYQERDLTRFKESMQVIERRFDPKVDKAVWLYFIERYLALPESQRLKSFDSFLGASATVESMSNKLDLMYEQTTLNDTGARLDWMSKTKSKFQLSEDPFIVLAVSLFDELFAIEKKEKALAGKFAALRPHYMSLLIEYYKDQGKPVYPDANSSLRVTYGLVKGYTPPAGTIKNKADGNDGNNGFVPFTTLRGIEAKYTGEDPFDSPEKQNTAIKDKQYGKFYKKEIDSVPVNFLSTVDITGGNSGSPTMNAKGEFIGIVFDGTYDSINADWDFNDNTRAIHVDVSYILWVMSYVDGAGHLIKEMGL